MRSAIYWRDGWTKESDLEAAQREVWDEGDRFQPSILVVPPEALDTLREFSRVAVKYPTGEMFWVGDYSNLQVVTPCVSQLSISKQESKAAFERKGRST